MHLSPKNFILSALILTLIVTAFIACGQESIVRDAIPEVKVSRADFIRGLIDATSSGSVNTELQTAISSFVSIYNSNQDNPNMKLSDSYKIYYNTNDQCYHVVDGDVNVAVNIQGAGVAHAYIGENDNIGINDRADGYKALIKTFQSGGYIPESVVADMAKIQAKANSIGENGREAFNTIGDTLNLINGETIVNTGVSYTVPQSVNVGTPVVNTSGMYNYGMWLNLDESLNEQITVKTLEQPTITTPAPLVGIGNMPEYTFAPYDQNALPELPSVTPAPSPDVGIDIDAAGRRQSLTQMSPSEESIGNWERAKQGVDNGKNILLTPGTPTDYSDRLTNFQGLNTDPGTLLSTLPDISTTLEPNPHTPRPKPDHKEITGSEDNFDAIIKQNSEYLDETFGDDFDWSTVGGLTQH